MSSISAGNTSLKLKEQVGQIIKTLQENNKILRADTQNLRKKYFFYK